MFGPFGLDPFGGEFLYALQGFTVRAAMEGPQVLISWAYPLAPIGRLMVRRKQREYPRHPEDGVLVIDLTENLPDTTGFADTGTDLLPAGAEKGDSAWWYYRAFVQPAPLPVADRFGGLGVQVSDDSAPWYSQIIDVQEFGEFRLIVENLNAEPSDELYGMQTAPEFDGPWISTLAGNVAAGTPETFQYSNASFKYVRFTTNVADLQFTLVAPFVPVWATSTEMSKPCLAYRSGRHEQLVWREGHLPELYIFEDGKQQLTYLSEEADLATAEVFNLGLDRVPQGPLQQFLRIILAEMDRSHAHLKAVHDFNTDIATAPEALLQHIAFELGWRVDMSQPLEDIRQELLRLAGVWKERGTALQFQRIVQQFMGFTPRVQESAGQMLRFVDPELI